MNAAIYARVSTADQTTDPQLDELRQYCQAFGWQATEYTDTISGSKWTRTGLDALMQSVRKGKIRKLISRP